MAYQLPTGSKGFAFGGKGGISTSPSPGKNQQYFDCVEEQNQKNGALPANHRSSVQIPINGDEQAMKNPKSFHTPNHATASNRACPPSPDTGTFEQNGRKSEAPWASRLTTPVTNTPLSTTAISGQ